MCIRDRPSSIRLAFESNVIVAQRVFFADRNDWFLHVGRSAAQLFTGSTADPQELADRGALLKAESAFLAESRRRTTQSVAQSAAILPNVLQTDPERIKISVDTLMDGLIVKLTPQ